MRIVSIVPSVVCVVSVVLGFGSSSVVMGQVSVEEAQRRLAERQAAATTQPIVPADQLELEKENASLRRELAKVKAELRDMKAILDRYAEAEEETKAKEAAKVKPTSLSDLIGLPLDEVIGYLGTSGQKELSANEDGTIYRLSYPSQPFDGVVSPNGGSHYIVLVVEGKVVTVDKLSGR